MKYIIEFEDEYSMNEGGVKYHQCKQVPYWSVSNEIIKNLTPYTEPDRKDIEDEVWEFVKEIILRDNGTHMSGMFENELNECFGYPYYSDMFATHSYQEAKSKYEAWKKHKDEVHVGDEVTSKFGDGVVIDIVGDESVHILGKDGHWNEYAEGEYQKTGRHFDEVAELLEKMREEE